MKKRLWCIALTLIMVVTLASGITVPVSAADEEFTEVIYFEENEDVKSTHFWLSSERVFPGGWGIGPYPKNPLTVHSTYSDIIITGLDLDITPGSNSWDNVSCDYGRNTGTTGSVGHIEDIYSRTVFLTAPWQDYVLVGNVTVHYKLHPSHDYSGPAKPSNDGKSHVFKCTGCEDYSDRAGQFYPHTYSTEYYDNGNGTHSHKCTVCDGHEAVSEPHSFGTRVSDKKATEATCTEAATYYVQCDSCEAISNSVTVPVGDPLPHPFPDTWEKYDAEQHQHNCTVCGTTEYEDHTWNKIEYEPIDAKSDKRISTCTICGESKTENLPELSYAYYTAEGNTAIMQDDGIRKEQKVINSQLTTLESGIWYALYNDVTIKDRITVNGTVNIILKNGTTLNAEKGFDLAKGSTLNIYAEFPEEGKEAGKIIASGIADKAGIDCGGSTLNIHGGIITAEGGSGASGIGGGSGESCGTVNIYGGTVTATGTSGRTAYESGAGIGGGSNGSSGTVTIYGGTIKAQGGPGAAGIGAGSYKFGDNITINGGTVTAIGGNYDSTDNLSGAGIGGGCALADTYDDSQGGGSGSVTINGGNITALSEGFAAGIGAGSGRANQADYDVITINKVENLVAKGGRSVGSAAGIAQPNGGISFGSDMNFRAGYNAENIKWSSEYGDDVNQGFKEQYFETLGHHVHNYNQKMASEIYFKSAANCTDAAVYYKSCICGETDYSETFSHLKPLGHSFPEAWEKYNTVQHRRACTVCDTGVAYEDHVWSDGEIKKPATHLEDGIEAFTCTKCGEDKTEIIPRISEHTFDRKVADEKYIVGRATCTKAAVYYMSCECGEASSTTVFSDDKPLGHNYGEWTYVDESQHQRICLNDPSHVEIKDHNFENLICSDCGYDINDYTVSFEMNGHGTAPSDQIVKAGSKAVKPEDPTESSWVFLGWYTDSSCKTEYDFDTEIKSDTTIYALWRIEGKWNKNSKGWWYSCSDGSFLADGIYKIDDEYYAFNENGYMVTGWYSEVINENKYWYHFASSGAKEYGWVKVGSKWYYMVPEDGHMLAGGMYTIADEDVVYCFDASGAMVTGWHKELYGEDECWFYFTSSGTMATSWTKVANKWYYMDPETGIMYAGGRYNIGENEYCFNASGAMITGWYKEADDEGNNYWYHFASSGAMDHSWTKVDTKWYYLDSETGIMYTGGRYDIGKNEYCFDASGAMVTGWYKETDDKGVTCWYYFDSFGILIRASWIDNCYVDANGVMIRNAYVRDGSKYYWINKDGKYTRTYNMADEGYDVYEQSTGELIIQ